MSQEEIITLIRRGEHDKALDILYQSYPVFKNSFRKAGGKRADAEDVFQDALLIFIEKVSETNFQLTTSINGFLFGICRNLSLVHFRKKGKEACLDLEIDEVGDMGDMDLVEQFLEREERYSALDKMLVEVGKRCMELLSLFYMQNMNMKTIAKEMGFKSETSAKTQKYKCIEKAKKVSKEVLVNREFC